jgi:hypothetical protein
MKNVQIARTISRLPRIGPVYTNRVETDIRTIEDMRSRLTSGLPILLLCLSLACAIRLHADAPAFDLVGPTVDVHVQRQGKTLPIAEVPNLLPGDRLWIHPDLPESQSAHYVLIVAFLRGSTNPPPVEWFKRVETWTKPVREEGVFVIVPAEAQQALLFLAPETTGDFSTLRKAVQGRPGAFVRATQDLQQASWDRLRLDAYLAEVKASSTTDVKDPKLLKEHTELAARSLGIRVDQQCFDKPTEQQAPCLVQHTDGLVLDDSNVQSIVTQMASGSAADMMNQLSYSSMGGAGQFSPYVGAVVDLARILSTIHTAKYQYIPALALPTREQRDTLNLRLNVPPSFRDPKSVIVVALPPIGPAIFPQMHPADLAQNPTQNYCAPKPGLALSAEGAPLVFATALAHDLTLHVETKATAAATPEHAQLTGSVLAKPSSPPPANQAATTAATPAAQKPSPSGPPGMDIAIRPEPSQGGFVLEKPLPNLPEDEVVGEIRGQWGFSAWEGPKFHLRTPHPGGWSVPDTNALITGREDALHIQGASTLCVSEVEAKIPEDHNNTREIKLPWKSPKPESLEVAVPLKDAAPGTVTIAIHQYGLAKPEELQLKAYAEAAGLDHLTLNAGDKMAVLKGKRLDEVDSADLAGISFVPAALNRVQDFDQLQMSATSVTATLQPGNGYSAKVTLRDGRMLHVPATVGTARPQIDVLSKGVQHDDNAPDAATPPPVHLGSPNDLPLQRRLVFFLRSRVPAAFARTERVEVAAVDGSFGTTLSLSDGSLMLEDAHTAVAVIDPMARFGASAFGPIQLRAITADGITGDWVPLGTLVRLPGFSPASSLRCPRNPAKPCQLTGANLFLVTAVSASPDMANAVEVPPEFSGTSITVPNTAKASGNQNSGTLYLRLRDDPDTVQTLNLPIVPPVGNLAGSDAAASQSSPSPTSTAAATPKAAPQTPSDGSSPH